MRILLVHPNHLSGGAEIAGIWPLASAAYLARARKAAGYTNALVLDAMADRIPDEKPAEPIRDARPDIIGTTAITPSICKAERVQEIARDVAPLALRILGGVHATFMCQQVLAEALQVNTFVRGENEEILLPFVRAANAGKWQTRRATIKGLAVRDGGQIVATPVAPTIKDLGHHRRAEQEGHPPQARGRHLHRRPVHRRPRGRTRRDAQGTLPQGAGLQPRPRHLGDADPPALQPAVPGTAGHDRGQRLRDMRHPHHHAGGDGARRAARPRDEHLPSRPDDRGAAACRFAISFPCRRHR
jgi:hypothetical protein